jgi:hypothetical protein
VRAAALIGVKTCAAIHTFKRFILRVRELCTATLLAKVRDWSYKNFKKAIDNQGRAGKYGVLYI